MNKFHTKFKHNPTNTTDDSSDYISDVETFSNTATKLQKIDVSSANQPNSGSSTIQQQQQQLQTDDSNDSYFLNDKDDSATSGFTSVNRFSKFNLQQFEHQQQNIEKSRLIECLDYLHRMIGRKDKEGIFEYPVTDLIAPGYSLIIKNPMDLSTMKKKIDSNVYNTVTEYRDDLILMCENCMTYNKMDTIYYHAARKMLDYGLKLLSREKLMALRHTVRIMRYLTPKELGFSLDGSQTTIQSGDSTASLSNTHTLGTSSGNSDHLNNANNKFQTSNAAYHKQSNHTQLISNNSNLNNLNNSSYTSRLGQNNSIIITKSKILQKVDALHQQHHQNSYKIKKDSYLIPAEGLPEQEDDYDQEDIDDLHEEVKKIAKKAAERLEQKNKNGKMGFLRRNSNGTTGYNFLANSNDYYSENETEKSVTIGNLCEGLQQSSYSLQSFLEDKKNKNKPMYYIENGPFSSHAPIYDSTYSNFSKEETDMLLLTYGGDETAYQYALSLMEFSKSNSQMFNKYVNIMLNKLTNNEHEKYLQFIQNRAKTTAAIEQPVIKTEENSNQTQATTTVYNSNTGGSGLVVKNEAS